MSGPTSAFVAPDAGESVQATHGQRHHAGSPLLSVFL